MRKVAHITVSLLLLSWPCVSVAGECLDDVTIENAVVTTRASKAGRRPIISRGITSARNDMNGEFSPKTWALARTEHLLSENSVYGAYKPVRVRETPG